MVMKLDNIVPFGRSFDEYQKMFSLTQEDLGQSIIGVGDGPASFNAELFDLGKQVISVDPVYTFNTSEIEQQFNSVVDNIIEQARSTPQDWVWSYHRSPDDLKNTRIAVIKRFLADFENGKNTGRYIVGELPTLDFADSQFQLAVCSHLLFLYSEQLSYEFHRASVYEMLRIAAEVRIFPLLTLMLEPSPYVDRLVTELQSNGFEVQIESVSYELQKGGNKMLRIRRPPSSTGVTFG